MQWQWDWFTTSLFSYVPGWFVCQFSLHLGYGDTTAVSSNVKWAEVTYHSSSEEVKSVMNSSLPISHIARSEELFWDGKIAKGKLKSQCQGLNNQYGTHPKYPSLGKSNKEEPIDL